jgi:uncharacterized membrane protein YgdD (TMEM256/DUF423 family)
MRLTAALGALAVIIGAFGAHGLKPHLDAYQAGIFEKGVQYQMYHTLAMGLAALLLERRPDSKWARNAAGLFLLGILFFSGSLYLLACRDLLPFPVAWAGPVTPFGGLCFIGGWISIWVSLRK